MKQEFNKLMLAMKRSGMTPPTKIVKDFKRHKFVAGEDQMGQPISGYYIFKDGVCLYWSKGLGINNKWSCKKVEQMTESEQRHYKKVIRELRAVRDNAGATVNAHSISRQSAIVNAMLMEEPGQKKQTAQKAQAKRQKAQAVSKWNDKEILNDRVARRFLLECIEVIGDRSAIKTLKLVALLNSNEQMPWYVYNTGKPIGNYHLSHLLGKFDIRSEGITFKKGKAKGFRKKSFLEAWHRVQKLLPSKK